VGAEGSGQAGVTRVGEGYLLRGGGGATGGRTTWGGDPQNNVKTPNNNTDVREVNWTPFSHKTY